MATRGGSDKDDSPGLGTIGLAGWGACIIVGNRLDIVDCGGDILGIGGDLGASAIAVISGVGASTRGVGIAGVGS